MNILLIKAPDERSDKLSFALESRYRGNVVSCPSWTQAQSALQRSTQEGEIPFDVAIFDLPECGGAELKLAGTLVPGLSLILCQGGAGSNRQAVEPSWNVVATVEEANILTGLFRAIDKLAAKAADEAVSGGYCKIRTKILLGVAPLKGDIYIRLSQSKFVKLFREGDVFERSDLTKYTEQKKIEYLYIKFDQCALFIEKYRQDLEKLLQPGVSLGLLDAAQVQNSVHETAQEMGRALGFTKDVQVLAKTQVRIAVKALKSSHQLKGLIEAMEANPGQYISSHSTLTGFLACAISSQLEWGSDATMYKLNLAAFLHDITLNNQALAECSSIAECEAGQFTEAEKEAFKNHPAKAAALAREFTDVPPDVDAILLQHHEWADGSGFPRAIGHAHISPLSAVFIVAHEMSRFIARGKASGRGPFKIEDFVYETQEKFNAGNFRKVLAAVKILRLEQPRAAA